MTSARKHIVYTDKNGFYHCIARCVRQAFLCGEDLASHKSFKHRKKWIKERIKFLASIFTIDIAAHAILSNHLHLLLHAIKTSQIRLNPEEIARRWLILYPKRRTSSGAPDEPNEAEIASIVNDPERIEELRDRLSSISWFMKSICEYTARRANSEDNCKGRFWEGRFKSIRLDTQAAILNCAIYIDLNPIRAKFANTPEESVFSSAYERIQALKARAQLSALRTKNHNNPKLSPTQLKILEQKSRTDSWLMPIGDPGSAISISLQQYLSLLDWTGRQIKKNKAGHIPLDLEPILKRIGINPAEWINSANNFGHWFKRVAGDAQSMKRAAMEAGQKWFQGVSVAKKLFQTPVVA